MHRILQRSIAACVICLGLGIAGQSMAEEEIVGTFDIRDGVPVIVADRMYRVTHLTQAEDLNERRMSLSEVPPGREVVVNAATVGVGTMPIATHITVLEPH